MIVLVDFVRDIGRDRRVPAGGLSSAEAISNEIIVVILNNLIVDFGQSELTEGVVFEVPLPVFAHLGQPLADQVEVVAVLVDQQSTAIEGFDF